MARFAEFVTNYANEPVYTRKDMREALELQAKRMTVNRVVKSLNGKYGPDCSVALQILAIHQTDEGTLVIVK